MAGSAGRRRLRVLLSAVSGGSCLILMAAVLAIYGRPYNGAWWWAMGAILVLAPLVPQILVRPIEWVIEGYSEAMEPVGGEHRRVA